MTHRRDSQCSVAAASPVAIPFAISTAAAVVATRVHPIVGLVVALTFALILGYLILAETGPAIREYYAGSAPWPTCPDGLPDWWPSWAPR